MGNWGADIYSLFQIESYFFSVYSKTKKQKNKRSAKYE